MSVFTGINPNLSESNKVEERQAIIRALRPFDQDSPAFKPLLFNLDIVGKKNCENLLGQVSIPVGIAGPVSVIVNARSTTTHTDILIPLATTEGALVASINRGCKALSTCHVKVNIDNVGMTRAPVFRCTNNQSATRLSAWIKSNLQYLGRVGEATSSHLKFLDCKIFVKDNLVFARFAFDTGEAMGMNMVTIAADAIVKYIIIHNPTTSCPALSSNICTDKKTSALTRRYGRGRRITVVSTISVDVITNIFKTTLDSLLETYHAKIILGSQLAGLAGRNMQIANVAAAILTATGQDIAHTVDISQGTIKLTRSKSGVVARLSLPSVPVGIVGGGTDLPCQSHVRSLISRNPVTSDTLATTIGVAALAGELSGLAALSTQSLSTSHQKLARSISKIKK